MFAKPKVRSSDGRWFEWEVVEESTPTASCPLCGGILSQRKPTGLLVVPTFPITGGYLVVDRFKTLADDLWYCQSCRSTLKLKDIGKQVISCVDAPE